MLCSIQYRMVFPLEFGGIPILAGKQVDRQTGKQMSIQRYFFYGYFYKNYVSTFIGLPVCLFAC